MLNPTLVSSSTTLMQALLGTLVVLASLVFLVGICHVNAWIVRLVGRYHSRSSLLPGPSIPATTPPHPVSSDLPEDILMVLAAAAAHILEEEVERVVILDIQAISHWKLEGRLAIHRNRLTSKAVHAPAFPSGGNSP